MSFVVTSLGSVADTAARSTYTCTVSGAPAPNDLVLVGVLGTAAAGTVVAPSSVSGCGMVFSQITSDKSFGATAGTETHDITLWRSMAASPVSSVVSVNFSITGSGCAIVVTTVSGVSTSGVSGANAVGKSAVSREAGNDSAITATGPSATSTANAWFSVGGIITSGLAEAPGQNWTMLDEMAYTTPATGLASGWTTLSTGTTAVWSGGGLTRRGAVIVELVLDNPAIPAVITPSVQGRRHRIPEVPAQITGILGSYLRQVARQLNAEGFVSLFSGSDPNTSGFTGIPGNMLVNIGSQSTWTRLWVQAGSVASVSTTSWHPIRVA